ncbi:hypothetical protein [Nocardioides bruguierae]|uniref:EfeO-type cupredoxin-like domain-containing protein n=1 Tax=Nocardioides bruguierae TaxID=2945102 RepID=A0A9X2D7E8_9ACTN|nr:hypothetical protein [Nocardioides bruguierae]MCM0620540.1 hypothetical protein [Nocardioides bruguierae]
MPALRHRHAALLALPLLVGLVGLSGCGEGWSAPVNTSDLAPEVVSVRITADSVEPNGDRVVVERGQTVVLEVDADEAGELHVHADPEQHLDYPAGESEQEVVITMPGIVEIESHSLEQTIVQLEVR